MSGEDYGEKLRKAQAAAGWERTDDGWVRDGEPVPPQPGRIGPTYEEVSALFDALRAKSHAGGNGDGPPWASLLVDGYTWLTTGTATVTARWGNEARVLAATGQPTLIVGDSGAGKTTIAQHLALGALGLPGHAAVLDLPVLALADDRTVLYLAADRPDQARLAMRRLVAAELVGAAEKADDDEAMTALRRLVVWQGPPPTSLATDPRLLWDMARHVNAGLVITDSTKDMARQLSDDAVGAAVNEAHQHLVANSVDLVALHHPRKRSQATPDGRAAIDDVYGSAWLVNGAGSVVFLVTEPAGTELWQAKTPNGNQTEMRYRHDTATGTLTVLDGDGVLAAVRDAGPDGIATTDVARWVMGRDAISEAETERFRRRLKTLEQTGLVAPVGQSRGSRWVAT